MSAEAKKKRRQSLEAQRYILNERKEIAELRGSLPINFVVEKPLLADLNVWESAKRTINKRRFLMRKRLADTPVPGKKPSKKARVAVNNRGQVTSPQ